MFLNFVLAAYLITMGAFVVLARNSIRRFDAVYRIGTGTWEVVVARLYTWTTIGFTVLYWIIPPSILSIEGWLICLFTIHLACNLFRLLTYLRRVQKPVLPHRN